MEEAEGARWKSHPPVARCCAGQIAEEKRILTREEVKS